MAELTMMSAWLVCGFIILSATMALFDVLFRFKPEKPADVVAIVRHMKKAELEAVLDPNVEAELRARLSPEQFRKAQKTRQKLLFEYVRRLAFNVMVMSGLALLVWRSLHTGKRPKTPQEEEMARISGDILYYAVWFRIYCVGALTKLGLRIALGMVLPTPHLFRMLDIQRIRGMMIYEVITAATGCLILVRGGRKQYQKFLDALGWPDLLAD